MLYSPRRITAAFTCLTALAGCMHGNADLVDLDTRNRIAVCSAGIGLELSVGLQAELSEFALGGTMSVEARQEIRGAIFGEVDPSNKATAGAFDSYLSCIRQETRLHQYVDVLESRSSFLLQELTEGGADETQIASIAELTTRHIDATRSGNLVLAHDLYRQITLAIIAVRTERPDLSENGGLYYTPS